MMPLAANDMSLATAAAIVYACESGKRRRTKLKRSRRFRRGDNHRRSCIIVYNSRGAGVRLAKPGNLARERVRRVRISYAHE